MQQRAMCWRAPDPPAAVDTACQGGRHDLRREGDACDEYTQQTEDLQVAKPNPDDPPVQRPPSGPRGLMPGPNFLGLEGRIALVQAQVFLLAVILIAQLWLITDALYELLSGRTASLGWLALASGIGFALR